MTDGTASTASPSRAGLLAALGRINPVWIVLLLVIIAITVVAPHFIQPASLMNFLKRAAPLAILAAGQLYVLVSGGFDLSQGSVITLTVIGSSILIDGDPTMVAPVIALMFAIGLVVGCVNGMVVSYLRVPSIIATLGMMIALGGVALTWSGGAPRGYLPDEFRYFGRALIRDVPVVRIIPIAVIVMIVVCAALWWAMHRTHFGRLLHAIGDNPRASRLAGAPVERVRILAFVVSALSAVVTGVMLGGFAGVSTDVGDGLELQAITAAVIGGALLLGGYGSVSAAVGGALTLTALFTLLNMLGLPQPMRDVVQGLILISAVALAMSRRARTGG